MCFSGIQVSDDFINLISFGLAWEFTQSGTFDAISVMQTAKEIRDVEEEEEKKNMEETDDSSETDQKKLPPSSSISNLHGNGHGAYKPWQHRVKQRQLETLVELMASV